MSFVHYFSFRSPYSWIATRLMLRSLPRKAPLEWVPFWEPDVMSERMLGERGGHFPYQKMSDAKHRYILQDVRRLALQLGLEMRWPVDEQPHWEVAHLGYLKATELGCGPTFLRGVYSARWEQGRNISDPDVIGEIGHASGLDGALVAEAYRDPAMRAKGVDCLYRVYQNDVFGVPYFMHKRDRYWGIDRLPLFLRQLGGDSTMATELAGDASHGSFYEFDHPGGCG
jgi:2-hydroxychromene-2-carboxylate isomerase